MSSSTNKHTQIDPPKLEQFRPVGTVTDDFEGSPSEVRTRKNFRARSTLLANDIDVSQLRGQKLNRLGVTGANGTVYAQPINYLLGFTSLAFSAALVLPQPSAVGLGKRYVVKDESGQAASTTITVTSAGGELIDGAASKAITTNYAAYEFYTEGTNWFVI